MSHNLQQEAETVAETPSEWIEKYFYVPDPRDPITGDMYPSGPLRLAEHQKRIINEALSTDIKGNLKYNTVIYSAPKKSGKSALTSAVILYVAMHHPNSFLACIANDGTQATDRLFGPIATCFRIHKQLGGPFKDISNIAGEVMLPNYTKVRAIPCDAVGEAGSNPLLVAYCYDDQTEILTRAGWKKYNEYSIDSEFATLASDGTIEYQKPTAINAQQYVGNMHLLDTNWVSLCVSPNHRLYGKVGHTDLKTKPFIKLPVEDVFKKTYYAVRVESLGIKEKVTNRYGNKIINTSSIQQRDSLMEDAVLHGAYVFCTEYMDRSSSLLNYSVTINKWIDGEQVIGTEKTQWKEIPYSGVIHCPTVPNGVVCIRRNGKVHWQGQSELWGFKSENKKRLFVEMTIPSTLYGKAMRWIETYAGHVGESDLLEQLYQIGVENGIPHPDFLDLQGKNGPVVKVNEIAHTFVYWDTEPRMPWQVDEYYQEQAAILPPNEYRRIHKNEWVSSAGAFVEPSWWDACENKNLSVLADGDKTSVVVGIDMAVSRDCAALVAVTRNPFNPETEVAVRAVEIFSPRELQGIIDQEKLVRPVLENWARRWNVVCFVYDPREMSKLAQDLVRSGLGWFKPFGQTTPRALSDKQLHDMILHRQIIWNRYTTEGAIGHAQSNEETLYKHITLAGATTENGSYRLSKLSNSIKIDGAVAAGMAAYQALQLNLANYEMSETRLLDQLRRREITIDEFSERMRGRFPRLEEMTHQ